MTPQLETNNKEVLPSISEIWDKLSELFKNKEHRDMFSWSLLSLLEFAKASEKKKISTWVQDSIKKMYDLIKRN